MTATSMQNKYVQFIRPARVRLVQYYSLYFLSKKKNNQFNSIRIELSEYWTSGSRSF